MSRKTGAVDYFYGGYGMITTADGGEKVYVHESDIVKAADGSFKNLSVGQTVEYEIEKQSGDRLTIRGVGQTVRYEIVKGSDGFPLVGGSDDDGNFCFKCCKHGHKARDCSSEEGHGGGSGGH